MNSQFLLFRSTFPEVFYKKAFARIFARFTGKHLQWTPHMCLENRCFFENGSFIEQVWPVAFVSLNDWFMKKFLHEKLIDLQQTKKYFRSDPINVYLFTPHNRNTRKRCKTCSKLIIETREGRHWRRSGIYY